MCFYNLNQCKLELGEGICKKPFLTCPGKMDEYLTQQDPRTNSVLSSAHCWKQPSKHEAKGAFIVLLFSPAAAMTAVLHVTACKCGMPLSQFNLNSKRAEFNWRFIICECSNCFPVVFIKKVKSPSTWASGSPCYLETGALSASTVEKVI